jgi:hypothetical protein
MALNCFEGCSPQAQNPNTKAVRTAIINDLFIRMVVFQASKIVKKTMPEGFIL